MVEMLQILPSGIQNGGCRAGGLIRMYLVNQCRIWSVLSIVCDSGHLQVSTTVLQLRKSDTCWAWYNCDLFYLRFWHRNHH